MAHSETRITHTYNSFKRVVVLYGALALGFLIGTRTVLATDYMWDGGASNNNWSDPENWDLDSGVPDGSDDTATIDPRDAVAVSMDGEYIVGELIIGEKALLNIARSKKLTLDGSGPENGQLTIQAVSETVFGVINIRDSGTFTFAAHDANVKHVIGGDIVLQNANSVLQVTDDDATFSPYDDGSSLWYGNVVGEHDDAQLLIESTFTLFVDIVVQGQMKIGDFGGAGDPEFELLQEGRVWANATGTLCFEAGVELDDYDTPGDSVWEASEDPLAILKFCSSSTLSGDIIIYDCATLELCSGIILETVGTISISGTIDAIGAELVGYEGELCTCLPNIGKVCQPLNIDGVIAISEECFLGCG